MPIAAITLQLLCDQLPKITKKELVDFYKLTYKEAYQEGRVDAKITCGCQNEDED